MVYVGKVRAIWPDSEYIVGPAAIAERTGIFGQPENVDQVRRAMATADPRSRGCFGAAWLLGVASQLVRCPASTADAVILGDLVGDRGVLECSAATVGTVLFPSFHVVNGLGRAAGATVRSVACSDAGRVAALSFVPTQLQRHRNGNAEEKEDEEEVALEVWLANLTADPVSISLCDLYAEEEGRDGGNDSGGGGGSGGDAMVGGGSRARAVWTVLDYEHAEQAAADASFMVGGVSKFAEVDALGNLKLDAFGVARVLLLA